MWIYIITGAVIGISAIMEHFFSLFRIVFTEPRPPTAAIEIDSEQHIFAHPKYSGDLQASCTFPVKTIYEVVLRGLRLSGDKPQFSFRQSSDQPFKSYTYKQVFEIVKEIASGAIHVGLKPSNETFFGIYASSSVNYALCLYSAWPYSMVPIGIYDSLGRDGVKFIIIQSAVELIYVDNLQRVQNLIEWKDEKFALKTIVSFVEPTENLKKLAEEKELKLLTLEELREIGRNNPVEVVPPKPTDIAMIMYTSGSTGEPKGCMILHEGFICAMMGMATAVDILDKENFTARVLNFMPLAHMFGCGTTIAICYTGGEIGFWQGNVEKLMDDFRDFAPTVLTMVPRLLNKLYDKVRLELYKKGIVGRILFRLVVQNKMALIRRGNFSQHTLWDKIIFSKIRQSFGSKVARVISSSAPLSPDVCQFSRAAFSCAFLECYGQTECVIGCAQATTDTEEGATGIPTPLNLVKLIDVPEKEYYAKNGIGEICIKSPAVFNGYLKNEEKTREAIDDDGWLRTGDIGRWTPNKTMKIVDRKKNMYKLSQGEYVAPEKIEDVYAHNKFISQMFVYGDSLQHFLIAIIVLNNEYVKQWAVETGHKMQDTMTQEMRAALKRIILKDMADVGKQSGLMSYEQVKAIEFIEEPFTIENGLLTPTFKTRRYAVEKKYNQLFQSIYQGTRA